MNYPPKTGAEYWGEEPKVFRTAKNVFRYYKRARRLTVSLPEYTPNGSTEKRPGKSVSIALDVLEEEPEALKAVTDILLSALRNAE